MDLQQKIKLETNGHSSFGGRIIFVGASTGGTEAVRRFLLQFPSNSPPILIVQHMPELFTGTFAARLDGLCQLKVLESKGNELIQDGMVYIAPGHSHLLIKKNQTHQGFVTELSKAEPCNRHRPSVDILFNSAAEVVGKNAIGVILTGMGKDGAKGLLQCVKPVGKLLRKMKQVVLFMECRKQ